MTAKEKRELIAELIRVGNQMANICYNGSQFSEMPNRFRVPMKELYPQWDAVSRRAFRQIQLTPQGKPRAAKG